jgi:hypothetical protein
MHDDPLKALAETLAHWVDALPGFPRFIYLAVGRGDHRKDSEVDVYSAARRFAIQGRTNMRSLAASAFLLVLLLPASLAAGPPSGVMPVVAREPMSGRSQAQAVKVACALPDACLAQLNTGEPQAPTRSAGRC